MTNWKPWQEFTKHGLDVTGLEAQILSTWKSAEITTLSNNSLTCYHKHITINRIGFGINTMLHDIDSFSALINWLETHKHPYGQKLSEADKRVAKSYRLDPRTPGLIERLKNTLKLSKSRVIDLAVQRMINDEEDHA